MERERGCGWLRCWMDRLNRGGDGHVAKGRMGIRRKVSVFDPSRESVEGSPNGVVVVVVVVVGPP